MKQLAQPNVAFHIETSHFIRSTNQMAGLYMECNIGLKWVYLTQKYFIILISVFE